MSGRPILFVFSFFYDRIDYSNRLQRLIKGGFCDGNNSKNDKWL